MWALHGALWLSDTSAYISTVIQQAFDSMCELVLCYNCDFMHQFSSKGNYSAVLTPSLLLPNTAILMLIAKSPFFFFFK